MWGWDGNDVNPIRPALLPLRRRAPGCWSPLCGWNRPACMCLLLANGSQNVSLATPGRGLSDLWFRIKILKKFLCWEELLEGLICENSFLVVNVKSVGIGVIGFLPMITWSHHSRDSRRHKYRKICNIYLLYMHIKLSIRERTWYTATRKWVKVQNESNNTAMPLLQNHSRLYSSKAPRPVLGGTAEELQCPFSQEKNPDTNDHKRLHSRLGMDPL